MNRPPSPDERPAGPDLRPGADLLRAAGGLLAGAVALSGCGPSPAEVRSDAADSKAHVLAVSREVLGPLTETGSFTKPPRGDWSGCSDNGGKVLYHVTARLDPPSPPPEHLVDVVRARLGAAGLALRKVGTDEDPLTLLGTRDDVEVQVTGYPTLPPVLFDVAGPCLDVGDLDEELLDEGTEHLVLG